MKKSLVLAVALLFHVVFVNAQSERNYENNATATLKNASRLFEVRDDLTSVITVLPAGTTVSILDSDSTYFMVKYDDTQGFIMKQHVIPDDSRNTIVTSAAENRSISSSARPATSERQTRISYLEDKYGRSVASRINARKIWKGMTPEMVKDSWGSPQRLSRIVNGNEMREEWTYKSTTLYFEKGELINWGPAKK